MKNRAVILAVEGDEEQFALLQKNLQWRNSNMKLSVFAMFKGFWTP
jgi:hypothetical protein